MNKFQTEAHIEGAHDEAHEDVSTDNIESAPAPTAADGGLEQGVESDSGSSSDGANSSDSSDSGGVTFLEEELAEDEAEADDGDDDGDGGLGVIAVLVGLVILFVVARGNSRNQPATIGAGPR